MKKKRIKLMVMAILASQTTNLTYIASARTNLNTITYNNIGNDIDNNIGNNNGNITDNNIDNSISNNTGNVSGNINDNTIGNTGGNTNNGENNGNNISDNKKPINSNDINDTYVYDSIDNIVTTKTGIKRTIPKVTGRYDRSKYPIPNENRVTDKETFELIKKENQELMDNLEDTIAKGKLTKHVSADGQFYGRISDDVLGVEKKANINTNTKGLHSLAVYVPAGEVATVKVNDEILKYAKDRKVRITVGMNSVDATDFGVNNKDENRMPYLGKIFNINGKETKVGTPFGGMIYIDVDESVPSGLDFQVEVSGVVDAPYFQLGKTTNEEWQNIKNAPGLFTEIVTPYLRFMVPSKFIRQVKNIEDALKFWTNATALSATVMNKADLAKPIMLTFDPYIKAGIAYATPGWWTCNLPPDWATGALEYDTLISSGNWGLIHEINHHFQSRYSGYYDEWGVGTGFDEITNNALNAISYIAYTNIAESRDENGTTDWNKVADPYSSLKQQMEESKGYYGNNPNIGAFMYSTIAHEIGPKMLAEVIKSTYDGATINGVYLAPYDYQAENRGKLTRNDRYDDLAYRICVAGQRDYTWYMEKELKWPLKEETVIKIKALEYDSHIPVQTVYAAGELGRETGRAFMVPSTGQTFDFKNKIITPGNFEIVDISKPKYGTLTKREDGKYDYKPNDSMQVNENDQFIVTVKVEKDGYYQETKLNCLIGVNYNTTKIEHYDITKWDIQDALEDIKIKSPYEISSSKTMRFDTHYGNKTAKSSGYFAVNESGDYQFQVFGDDNCAFRLFLEDGTTLESITEDYSANVQDAYNNSKSKHFKVNLEAGKAYKYELIANNKGGIGWGDVNIRKISKDNKKGNWETINKVALRKEDINKNSKRTFVMPNPLYVRPSTLAAGNKSELTGIKVLKHPIGVIPNSDPLSLKEGDPNSIVDGDINTYFHSSYTDGNRTQLPHEYVFDLGDKKTFNYMEVLTRRTGEEVGVIGDYEIYVANEYNGDNTQWRKVAEDKTRYGNWRALRDLHISITKDNARYIKVKALNNRDYYNLTILAEFGVANKTNVNNVIAQNSSFINYKDYWTKDTNGAFVNGATYNTTTGEFTYTFDGTESNIYVTKDVEVEVKIDGGEWKKEKLKGSLRAPSITLNMDNKGKHTVQVRTLGQEIALNMLSTDGEFIKKTDK